MSSGSLLMGKTAAGMKIDVVVGGTIGWHQHSAL
jgi:hypothetical protein